MSVKIISDFNPTQTIYAIGDDKHVECVIEGPFNDNFRALASIIASFVHQSAEACMKGFDDEEINEIKSQHEGMTSKDIGVVIVWRKLQDEVNEELVKLKIKDGLEIPDIIKKSLPKGLVDAIISSAVSDMMGKVKHDMEEDEDE